jgi:hypothetical protein
MQRFLSDLIKWTLAGRIKPRQASVCRAIVATNLDIGGYREVAERLNEIEGMLGEARRIRERAEQERDAVITHVELAEALRPLPREIKEKALKTIEEQEQATTIPVR